MFTVDVKQQCNNNNNSIVGNHALPVIRRAEQQLEHALCFLDRKSYFACHYEGETIAGARSLCYWKKNIVRLLVWGLDDSWSMVFVSSLGNNAPPVAMKVIQQLELAFVSSMGNYISPVVMRAEQMLEYCLCSWKSCLASPFYSWTSAGA